MAGSQSGFFWYELMSTDVAGAKAFYGNVIGWKTQDMPMPDMTYTILQAAETGVGGMMPMPAHAREAGAKPNWTGYIYTDGVDAAVTKLVGLGGTVHRAPSDIPDVGRFAVAADPQGAVFQLLTPRPAQPGQSGNRTPSNAPGHTGWHELHTTDWPRAFDFYGALFGWLKGDSMDMGPMGKYQLFTIDGVAVGGMMNSPMAAQQRFWLFYFNVDDIEAAAQRVAKGGGKVTEGPHQVPGGSWVIQATDPQGALFAMVGPKKIPN
jgi:predicted enzyme related to lactoylglutathione lyase